MIGRNLIRAARNAGRLQSHARPVAITGLTAKHLHSSSIRRDVKQADVTQAEESALEAHFGESTTPL